MFSRIFLASLVASASALVPGLRMRAPAANARSAVEMKVALIYSTTTGNTETVAGYLSEALGVEAKDIADMTMDEITGADGLICGAPTWHTGADSERSGTEWDSFLYGDLTSLDLAGKKVAIFGLGDQAGYSDNFCDAMDELATCFKGQGAEIIGSTSAEGYDHTESKSDAGGTFVGCPFDEDNQPEMSEERVTAWLAKLKSEGMAI